MESDRSGGVAQQPSFTAMWHAWLRNAHATTHASPIFTDTRSIDLVPEPIRHDVVAVMDGFSRETAEAIILMAVIRHRVLADRLPSADERGIRQLVVLGAGLDTTAFALPAWAQSWRVFEVDHPATQEWKRQTIAALGWEVPSNLVFSPCDFETQDLSSALDDAGFDRELPALVSLFGVIVYLTAASTRTLLSELASFAPGSEVLMTYSPPPGGPDPVVEELWDKSSSKVDETGESWIGYYTESEIERLVREAGFHDVIHHEVNVLNMDYFADRPDGLRLRTIEQLLTAVT
jgi:methyltransferase (TIGR00027 family)